jgi:SAM-dependent methyltransferase
MTEFDVKPQYIALLKYEFGRLVRFLYAKLRKRSLTPPLLARYSPWQGKLITLKEKLAFVDNKVSWFYSAFDRGQADPLTNRALGWIEQNVPRDKSILMTGCGTGLMTFHLAEKGFSLIQGRDLLPECISIANTIKKRWGYKNTEFLVDDGFKPKFQPNEEFFCITAMHWVFSAWMGNYGNDPIRDPYSSEVRRELLCEFLDQYLPVLSPGGFFIIELTDAIADYRDPFDQGLGPIAIDIYPVRQTLDMVRECAFSRGMEVADKWCVMRYGHQPRTSYYLRKLSK